MEIAALDVTDADAIVDIVGRVGRLDGLFNCVGIVPHGTILDLTDAEWERSVALNVTSMVRLTRAVLPGML